MPGESILRFSSAYITQKENLSKRFSPLHDFFKKCKRSVDILPQKTSLSPLGIDRQIWPANVLRVGSLNVARQDLEIHHVSCGLSSVSGFGFMCIGKS